MLKIFTIVCAAALCIVPQVSTADITAAGIEEEFALSSSADVALSESNVLPGDTFEVVVGIQNDTESSIEVNLYSIDNLIDDLSLFDVVSITVTNDDGILYDGLLLDYIYNKEATSTISASETENYIIGLTVNSDASNDYQGTTLNIKLNFGANSISEETDDLVETDDNEDNDDDTTTTTTTTDTVVSDIIIIYNEEIDTGVDLDTIGYILLGLSGVAAIGLYINNRNKKDTEE